MHNITELTQSATTGDKHTLVLRPYISLKYNIADNYSIGTYYTMFVGYPTISELNPAVAYSDTLHYEKGNENLENVYTHKVALYANIKDLSLGVDLKRINNMIVRGMFPYSKEGAIIEQPVNSLYSNILTIKVSYSTKICGISIDPSLEYSYQFTKLPEITGMFNSDFGQHNIFVSCDLSYKFWKNAEAFCKFYYQSPCYESNMRIGRTLGLDVGVSKSFFKGRLRTALELTDIFGQSVTPWWRVEFSNIREWQSNRYDTRGARLSVRYTFNSVRVPFRNARINKSSDGRAD